LHNSEGCQEPAQYAIPGGASAGQSYAITILPDPEVKDGMIQFAIGFEGRLLAMDNAIDLNAVELIRQAVE